MILAQRVWFHPARFWNTTKEMTQKEADQLFETVWRMAEDGDLEGLRDFDFVCVGDKDVPPELSVKIGLR